MSSLPYHTAHSHPSANDNDDSLAFPNLPGSPSGSISPSVTSIDNNNSIPLLNMPTHLHGGFKRSAHHKRSRVDDLAHRSSFLIWLNGTPPYEKLYIKSTYPRLATFVQEVSTMWLPGRPLTAACAVLMLVWTMAFTFILTWSYGGRSSLPDETKPVRIACQTRLWQNTTFCGYEGINCAPFADKSFTFICPAQCTSVQVLEPHIIGDQEVIYSNMVIGGPSADADYSNVYRGDSFICQAAIHAGIIKNSKGGCGILTRIGERRNFIGTQSNGISSIGVSPAFPLAYTVSSAPDYCTDPQWQLLFLSVVTSIWVSFLATTPQHFIALTSVIVFFQVGLASDRPFHSDLAGMVSMAFERFLPTTFVIYTIYRFCIRHTLNEMQASLERALFWTGGCWIGALNNYTFDRMPISRLTPHDLRQQPGAVTALLIIIAIIALAAIGQITALRAEGRLLRYVLFYIVAGFVFGVLAMIPALQLRLHHYILALLLLPGTSVQTRRSMLYQGLLFGLFLNGIARWGYSSILQTAEALREDGQLGSALPEILPPSFIDHSIIRFTIEQLAKGFDGVSVLVNDVERYRLSPTSLPMSFNWTRSSADDSTFFRFAFTSFMPLGGLSYGDFTKTGIWHKNGTWENMNAGPSK